DQDRCYRLAAGWLPGAFDDPDLAEDTRVAVPVFMDLQRQVTRIWATLGVRMAKLDASYARPPHWRREKEEEWELVDEFDLGEAHYLIPVDEFAEVELPGLKVLDREEFRSVCDRGETKEAIVAALQGGHFGTEEELTSNWLLWAGGAAAVLIVLL